MTDIGAGAGGGQSIDCLPDCKEPGALEVAQNAIWFLQLLLLVDNGVL